MVATAVFVPRLRVRYVSAMRRVTACLFVFAFAGSIGAQQGEALSYEDLLHRMTDVDWLWQAPKPGERCIQFSSYDRRSNSGPENFDEWYANDDRGKYRG